MLLNDLVKQCPETAASLTYMTPSALGPPAQTADDSLGPRVCTGEVPCSPASWLVSAAQGKTA